MNKVTALWNLKKAITDGAKKKQINEQALGYVREMGEAQVSQTEIAAFVRAVQELDYVALRDDASRAQAPVVVKG